MSETSAPSTTDGTTQNGTADEDSCDDCNDLPPGWPCADCFIEGGEEITAEGYRTRETTPLSEF
jgi:hypothetical protein